MTAPPQHRVKHRVPHVRYGFIVANVGMGTFVEAAANRIAPDTIPEILAARNRSAAGPTAPASGLFLVEVEY